MADTKCRLNEYCQQHRTGSPVYETHYGSGGFVSTVTVAGVEYTSEEAHGSKKAAEKDAANVALSNLVKPLHSFPASLPARAHERSLAPSIAPSIVGDPKCRLNEYCQQHCTGSPEYDTHWGDGGFVSTVTVAGEEYTSEEVHGNKKEAEKDAANVALSKLVKPLHSFPSPLSSYPPLSLPTSLPTHPLIMTGPAVVKREPPAIKPRGSIGLDGLENEIGRMRITENPMPLYNFEEELEQYCLSQSFLSPDYRVTEDGARFTAHVRVNGVKYGTAKTYESEDLARESATLVALACIGLRALKGGGKEASKGTIQPAVPSSSFCEFLINFHAIGQ